MRSSICSLRSWIIRRSLICLSSALFFFTFSLVTITIHLILLTTKWNGSKRVVYQLIFLNRVLFLTRVYILRLIFNSRIIFLIIWILWNFMSWNPSEIHRVRLVFRILFLLSRAIWPKLRFILYFIGNCLRIFLLKFIRNCRSLFVVIIKYLISFVHSIFLKWRLLIMGRRWYVIFVSLPCTHIAISLIKLIILLVYFFLITLLRVLKSLDCILFTIFVFIYRTFIFIYLILYSICASTILID